VKNSGGESSDSKGEEHVAELADGRIGKDFFDVILDERHGAAKIAVAAPTMATTSIAIGDS